MSEWKLLLSRAALKEHEGWLARERSGPGRLQIEGGDLSGAKTGGVLTAARWLSCDVTRARLELSNMQEVEFESCAFVGASLRGCDLEGAQWKSCSFVEANLRLVDLVRARVVNCDFSGAALERSSWNGSLVEGCSFRDAHLVDSVFDDAEFRNCDFRGANLSWSQGPPLGTARKSSFIGCDFRQADFSKLRLEGSTLRGCAVYGLRGEALLESPCVFRALDFSSEADGSDVRDAGPWKP